MVRPFRCGSVWVLFLVAKSVTQNNRPSCEAHSLLARFVLSGLEMIPSSTAHTTDLRSLLLQLGVTVIAYVYVGCGGLARSGLRAAG